VSNTPPEWDKIREFAMRKTGGNRSVDWFDASLLAPVDIFQLGLLLFYRLTGKSITNEIWEECTKITGATDTQRPAAKNEYKKRVRCLFSFGFSNHMCCPT